MPQDASTAPKILPKAGEYVLESERYGFGERRFYPATGEHIWLWSWQREARNRVDANAAHAESSLLQALADKIVTENNQQAQRDFYAHLEVLNLAKATVAAETAKAATINTVEGLYILGADVEALRKTGQTNAEKFGTEAAELESKARILRAREANLLIALKNTGVE